jgi:hypothetical protein
VTEQGERCISLNKEHYSPLLAACSMLLAPHNPCNGAQQWHEQLHVYAALLMTQHTASSAGGFTCAATQYCEIVSPGPTTAKLAIEIGRQPRLKSGRSNFDPVRSCMLVQHQYLALLEVCTEWSLYTSAVCSTTLCLWLCRAAMC